MYSYLFRVRTDFYGFPVDPCNWKKFSEFSNTFVLNNDLKKEVWTKVSC